MSRSPKAPGNRTVMVMVMIATRIAASATSHRPLRATAVLLLLAVSIFSQHKTALAWKNWTIDCSAFQQNRGNAPHLAGTGACDPTERRGHSQDVATLGVMYPSTAQRDGTGALDSNFLDTNPAPGTFSAGRFLILFGGRSNDIQKDHTPKTYQIQEDQGVLFIENYEDKPVGNEGASDRVNVGLQFNDVWAYPLDCASRQGDNPCPNDNWVQLHKGAPLGGCRMIDQGETCPFPTERYEHTAALVKYGSPVPKEYLYIYGGFSTFCQDYCKDMWRFDFTVWSERDKEWEKPGDPNPWTEVTEFDEIQDHPGKRWRLASAVVGSSMYVFGGYRLWHGFRAGNDIDNRWSSVVDVCTPKNWATCTAEHRGGYLDDLWKFRVSDSNWFRVQAMSETIPNEYDRYYYDSRSAMMNRTVWPSGRAGHSLTVVKEVRNRKCLLASDCINGTGECVKPGTTPGYGCGCILGRCTRSCASDSECTALGAEWKCNHNGRCYAEVDCETHPNDCSLFLFGGYRTEFPYPLTSSAGAGGGAQAATFNGFAPYPSLPYFLNDLWQYNISTGLWKEIIPQSSSRPSARQDHILVQSGVMLILFAGYAENHHHDDVWYFNLTSHRWLEKETHVYPRFATSCTQDSPTVPTEMSVVAVPTRDTNMSGLFGRANTSVLIMQKRNQAPGWDGCRDRVDGKPYPFPQRLLWEEPLQISMHRAIYSTHYDILLTYGGHGFLGPVIPSVSSTNDTRTNAEFWQFNINECPSACNGRGACEYGFCFCDNGYYGLDCSNISCPGDFSYYDESHKQVNKHCCSAPFKWNESGYDTYLPHYRKVPCDKDHEGVSNGICDGFGECQCAPPFLGPDCSIRDCPYNNDPNSEFFGLKCSGNGWCSIEYPVSRCMCDREFQGTDCAGMICLNNCSWPNGECVKGTCVCNEVNDPFNKTKQLQGKWWRGTYGGADCSYMIPFAAAPLATAPTLILSSALIVVAVLMSATV